MHILRVGVLMGGKSLEKEVSLNSGRTVCDHLDTAYYAVVPLFQTTDNDLYILPQRFLHRGKISDFEARLKTEAQKIYWDDLKQYVDFVYIAQHGRFGEDGCMQGVLEILGIPYFGSKVFASALGMNKRFQKEILKNAGIAVAKGFCCTPHEITQFYADSASLLKKITEHRLEFPLIVKPEQEGSSFGVSVAHNLDELLSALEYAATIHSGKKQNVLVEEFLRGMEFSCIVLTDYINNKPLPLVPTEVVAEKEFYDYEQKYMPGRAIKFTPARISPEAIKKIQDTAIAAMHVLGMNNVARVDGFLLENGTIVITDPNTFTATTPTSFTFVQAAYQGMSHTDLINHLIKTELHYYGKQDSMQQDYTQNTHDKKRIKVAVLFGGRSNEREISLESGRNIIYKLSPYKYEPIPLFVSSKLKLYQIPQHLLVRNRTQEIELNLESHMHVRWHDLPQIADFVFIGLHGGEGENGTVQGMLEMLGMPYNGSGVLTSALCMDKYKTNTFLRSQGFHVPQGILYTREMWEANPQPTLDFDFPVIVKPHDDGCSVYVSKAHNHHELHELLVQFFATDKSAALIEEYIKGMELTVGVIGNDTPYALPPSQAVAVQGILSIEEKFLPGAGENQTPALLPKETLQFVQRTMEQVYKAIDAKGYVRIDCFYQTAEQSPTGIERVVVLEVNTLPGMTPATCIFHQAAELGIKPMDFVDKIITLGFELHKPQSEMLYSSRNFDQSTIEK